MKHLLPAAVVAAVATLPGQGGNRVMDFSHAGFKGGGVALPNVHVARRLQPSGGDDTAQITAAIAEVSRLAPNAQGFRGAVQLGAGSYTVAGALKISASGVVLRGVGSGEGGSTVSVTGPPRRFLEVGGTGSVPGRIEQVGFESLRVTVPAGDGSGISAGRAPYALLRMAAVIDAWVRDIVVEDTQNTFTIDHSVRRVTLENVHVRHAPSLTGSAPPADFAISGSQILLHRSTVTGNGVWPIVTPAGVTGPNVVLYFKADEAGGAPRQPWPPGLLVEPGAQATPPSLYLVQLQARLGAAAVRNIGYIPR